MSQEASNPGQILREHLFEGELLHLPKPEEGIPGFLPDWFEGELPALVYPPLRDRNLEEGAEVNLEITPYHIYYGTLRELAESAGGTERAEQLKELVQQWNANAAIELCELARLHIERALLHYELAQELDPDLPGMDETVSLCESALDAAPGGEDGGIPQEQAAGLDPDQQAFQEAQMLLATDPARSVELLQPVAEKYPDSGEVWFILGCGYRRTQDHAEAERCLRRAARLLPTEPFIWWELSQTLAEVSQWRAADEAIRKALEFDPDNVLYLCDHSRILLALGDRDGAEEVVRKAQELLPDDPTVQEAAKAVFSSEA